MSLCLWTVNFIYVSWCFLPLLGRVRFVFVCLFSVSSLCQKFGIYWILNLIKCSTKFQSLSLSSESFINLHDLHFFDVSNLTFFSYCRDFLVISILVKTRFLTSRTKMFASLPMEQQATVCVPRWDAWEYCEFVKESCMINIWNEYL